MNFVTYSILLIGAESSQNYQKGNPGESSPGLFVSIQIRFGRLEF